MLGIETIGERQAMLTRKRRWPGRAQFQRDRFAATLHCVERRRPGDPIQPPGKVSGLIQPPLEQWHCSGRPGLRLGLADRLVAVGIGLLPHAGGQQRRDGNVPGDLDPVPRQRDGMKMLVLVRRVGSHRQNCPQAGKSK